jgi:hypothetical protein
VRVLVGVYVPVRVCASACARASLPLHGSARASECSYVRVLVHVGACASARVHVCARAFVRLPF